MVHLYAYVSFHCRLGRHDLHADADDIVHRVSPKTLIFLWLADRSQQEILCLTVLGRSPNISLNRGYLRRRDSPLPTRYPLLIHR